MKICKEQFDIKLQNLYIFVSLLFPSLFYFYWIILYFTIYRVIAKGDQKEINGFKFEGFGAHINQYPCTYLTAAAAIGMTKSDVDMFIKRLDKVLTKTITNPASNGATSDITNTAESEQRILDGATNGLKNVDLSKTWWNNFCNLDWWWLWISDCCKYSKSEYIYCHQ